MLQFEIPGREDIRISHLVLDYNGTIAVDGELIEGIAFRIRTLAGQLQLHVLTADTYGSAAKQLAGLPVELHTFPNNNAAQCKLEIVRSLQGGVCCFGNGYNDIPMFEAADLTVAVLDAEGMCAQLLPASRVLVRDALDAFDLLLRPGRLKAALRA